MHAHAPVYNFNIRNKIFIIPEPYTDLSSTVSFLMPELVENPSVLNSIPEKDQIGHLFRCAIPYFSLMRIESSDVELDPEEHIHILSFSED